MAIVKLRKITMLGKASLHDHVLEGLQRLGCVHLIDLADKQDKEVWQHPIRSELHDALRYLEACPDQRPTSTHTAGYDPHKVSRVVLENRSKHRELSERRENLIREIDKITPWGNFTLPSSEQIGGRRLWFYRLRHRQVATLKANSIAYTLVSRDNEFEYVVVIAKNEPVGVPVAATEMGQASLSELQEELVDVDQKLEALDLERISMTRWVSRLTSDLAMADDETSRMAAAQQLIRDGEVFALQGWVPEKTFPTVCEFAKKHYLALTSEKPTYDDAPPTLLSNPTAVAGAEGAVTFYMTPGYRAWDPTWIMYLSFSLFFAMIMADAGYGVVLGVVLILMFGRLGKTETLKRFRYLAIFMVSVTIGYGVLIGSYFGFAPPAGSFLDGLVWKTGGLSIMENREAMMLLSAGIGVVHLAIANLVVAWQRLGSGRALSHVGWAAALLGGFLMAIAKLEDPALVPWIALKSGGTAETLADGFWKAGALGLAVGLGAVFFFSSERPIFSSRASHWLWRPLEGLMGLTNISKAFGDALSYLRLFALGLASAQLAITFNGLASQVSEVPGVGLFLGLLVFLAGHTLNLVLGVVGGVVHGLRLNCIEFFSWSLTDEGYPFQAFRKKADC